MSFFRFPNYYTKFSCLADKCRDTCCSRWEIDVDDKTYGYMQNVGGELGKKLLSNIIQGKDGRYIKLNEHGFCPFLTENKLCSLYSRLGEEHVSAICREHPRWYNWYSNGREAGMGICCEEVARLVMSAENDLTFSEYETDEITDEDYSETDIAVENFLLEKREEIFSIIKNNIDSDIDEITNAVCNAALKIQDEYDSIFMCGGIVCDGYKYDFVSRFFTKENIMALTDTLLSFEIIDGRWREMLILIKDNITDVLKFRKSFISRYKDKKRFARLLHYFVYRYFTQAFSDDDIFSKVNYALISVCYLQLLFTLFYIKNEVPDAAAACDICKIYSAETEYDTDIREELSHYPVI